MSPLLGTAARRKGQPMPDSDQRDAGSWPCQTHEDRAVHRGLFSRKQLGKRRTFILDMGKLVLGMVSTPLPLLGIHPAHRHCTQPAMHTCSHTSPACSCPCSHPMTLSLHPPAADPSASPYTHYYLGQASTDTSSTLWEINYPPCRWKSHAMASWLRCSPHLANHGL